MRAQRSGAGTGRVLAVASPRARPGPRDDGATLGPRRVAFWVDSTRARACWIRHLRTVNSLPVPHILSAGGTTARRWRSRDGPTPAGQRRRRDGAHAMVSLLAREPVRHCRTMHSQYAVQRYGPAVSCVSCSSLVAEAGNEVGENSKEVTDGDSPDAWSPHRRRDGDTFEGGAHHLLLQARVGTSRNRCVTFESLAP
jgi:hypothetical protein